MNVVDIRKLLYRNQFILGPHWITEQESWKRIKINDSIFLSVNTDLNTSQCFHSGKSITLLGYILDPNNPENTNQDIVNDLIKDIDNFQQLMTVTFNYGGRWLLIIDNGQEIRLFHDAAGLRQAFYTDRDFVKESWCASQPGLIADILHLEMDKDAISFIKYFESLDDEYWWPGDSSPYKEIKHLLPNHYLNFKTCLTARYWPTENLPRQSLNEAADKTISTLKGLMKGAFNRFDLVISLTSGWDSRLILAACREISDSISYMTIKLPQMKDDHPDIKIPSSLLLTLGLKHDIVQRDTVQNKEFIEIFKQNSPICTRQMGP